MIIINSVVDQIYKMTIEFIYLKDFYSDQLYTLVVGNNHNPIIKPIEDKEYDCQGFYAREECGIFHKAEFGV